MKHENKVEWLKNQVDNIIANDVDGEATVYQLVAFWEADNNDIPSWYWDEDDHNHYHNLIERFVEAEL